MKDLHPATNSEIIGICVILAFIGIIVAPNMRNK